MVKYLLIPGIVILTSISIFLFVSRLSLASHMPPETSARPAKDQRMIAKTGVRRSARAQMSRKGMRKDRGSGADRRQDMSKSTVKSWPSFKTIPPASDFPRFDSPEKEVAGFTATSKSIPFFAVQRAERKRTARSISTRCATWSLAMVRNAAMGCAGLPVSEHVYMR